MGKTRPAIPAATVRALRLEAGYRCSVPHCGATSALEIHHIDGNPENNDVANLLLLCANHHARVTRKEIDRKECELVKKQLKQANATPVDVEALAERLAERLSAGQLPDPLHADTMTLRQLAEEVESRTGARVEVLLVKRARVCGWLRVIDGSAGEVRSVLLDAACLLSGLPGIDEIELGLSNTAELPHTVGSDRIAAFQVRFSAEDVAQIARNKRIPRDLWMRTSAILLEYPNTPFMSRMAIPFSDALG
jgi:hypothetical protein